MYISFYVFENWQQFINPVLELFREIPKWFPTVNTFLKSEASSGPFFLTNEISESDAWR